jgi:hypothetical protein
MARKVNLRPFKVLPNGARAMVDRRPEMRGLKGPAAGGFLGTNPDGSEDWSGVMQALDVAAGMSARFDGNSAGGSYPKLIISKRDLERLTMIVEMAMLDDLRHYKSLTYKRWAEHFHPHTAPVITDTMIRRVRKSIAT